MSLEDIILLTLMTALEINIDIKLSTNSEMVDLLMSGYAGI
jgi:hypothetical protein